ncbi:endonuclease/exonuclease/phosphatase family protein, partial [Amycolatopsis sp. NPDC000740]
MLDLILLALAAVPLAMLATRFASCKRGRPVAALAALFPYCVPAGCLLAAVSFALGRWAVGGLAATITVLASAFVAPRAWSQPSNSAGTSVRVLTANLLRGRADAAALVELVREHRVDLLCLQELTVDAVQNLKHAGLADEMPHVLFDNVLGRGRDTGLASRHSIVSVTAERPYAVGGIVRLADGRLLEVFAAHPIWPMSRKGPSLWYAAVADLPRAVGSGPVRVLAGDLNATLDHRVLRDLMASGYRDAAAAA